MFADAALGKCVYTENVANPKIFIMDLQSKENEQTLKKGMNDLLKYFISHAFFVTAHPIREREWECKYWLHRNHSLCVRRVSRNSGGVSNLSSHALECAVGKHCGRGVLPPPAHAPPCHEMSKLKVLLCCLTERLRCQKALGTRLALIQTRGCSCFPLRGPSWLCGRWSSVVGSFSSHQSMLSTFIDFTVAIWYHSLWWLTLSER